MPGNGAQLVAAVGSLAASCNGAETVAIVGSEVILACEVNSMVEQEVEHAQIEAKGQIPPDQLEQFRSQRFHQALLSRIQIKMVYLDFKRDMPAEKMGDVEKQVSEAFENEEVAKMLKRLKVESRVELDAKLRRFGSSLDLEKRMFIETILAHEQMRRKAKFEGEIGPEEIEAYYRQHYDDFLLSLPQAKWEELAVHFSSCGSRADALQRIARLGNQVQGGASLAEVARQGSDGLTAVRGGQRDWTNQGSLACKELDQALFGLPLGALSQIIEGPQGYHIIRVLDRRPMRRTSFADAQASIREKIRDQKKKSKQDEYLAQLAKQTPVTTIFDDRRQARRQIGGRW